MKNRVINYGSIFRTFFAKASDGQMHNLVDNIRTGFEKKNDTTIYIPTFDFTI